MSNKLELADELEGLSKVVTNLSLALRNWSMLSTASEDDILKIFSRTLSSYDGIRLLLYFLEAVEAKGIESFLTSKAQTERALGLKLLKFGKTFNE